MTRNVLLILLTAAAVACARSTPEQQIVNDAAEALGGSERILAVKTLVIEGEGTQGNLGQDINPEANGQTFEVSGYRRAIDIAGGRARTELTRTPNFPFFQGQQPQRQVNGVDGAIGYNVAASGTATRTNEATANDRRLELLHHPVTAVRAALDPMAMLANARTEGGESLVDVTTADGRRFTLAIDSTTKLPARVITMANNNNLGDVAVSTIFADYQEVSGLQLPSSLASRTDEFRSADIRVTTQTVDGDAGDLAAPADAANAPAPGPPPAPNVTVEEIGRGVWFLAGGGANSVLIEFDDHMKLVEAPTNDARTLAVIARAREVRPNKPVTHLINTHHHFDHSGGVRAAISEGLTLITHAGNAALFEEIAKRPHTLVPDALSMNPKPLMIEPVKEDTVLQDGTMTIHLYPLSGNHTETMLYVYIPRERLLIEADVYSPASSVAPFIQDFFADVQRRNLRVDRIAPIHGPVTPFAQFVKVATSAPAAATN